MSEEVLIQACETVIEGLLAIGAIKHNNEFSAFGAYWESRTFAWHRGLRREPGEPDHLSGLADKGYVITVIWDKNDNGDRTYKTLRLAVEAKGKRPGKLQVIEIHSLSGDNRDADAFWWSVFFQDIGAKLRAGAYRSGPVSDEVRP